MWGIPIFSTAEVPSESVTGATHAQLVSPLKGASARTVNDQRRWMIRTTSGKWSSHTERSGLFRQADTNPAGRFNAIDSF
jgi:hypothetical protein